MNPEHIFPRLLLRWFKSNKRHFVWREMIDPYSILVAEIMLQRTRAEQVEPVLTKFLEEFPLVQDLDKATEEEVLKYIRQLGLFWRAKLMKQLARKIVEDYSGRVPESKGLLISLPAVGEYISDAVLCFAYGNTVAIIDSNVCRLIGRVFGLKSASEARRDLRFREIVQRMIPQNKAKEFNWAMIDLASLLCSPANPSCSQCPLLSICNYPKK